MPPPSAWVWLSLSGKKKKRMIFLLTDGPPMLPRRARRASLRHLYVRLSARFDPRGRAQRTINRTSKATDTLMHTPGCHTTRTPCLSRATRSPGADVCDRTVSARNAAPSQVYVTCGVYGRTRRRPDCATVCVWCMHLSVSVAFDVRLIVRCARPRGSKRALSRTYKCLSDALLALRGSMGGPSVSGEISFKACTTNVSKFEAEVCRAVREEKRKHTTPEKGDKLDLHNRRCAGLRRSCRDAYHPGSMLIVGCPRGEQVKLGVFSCLRPPRTSAFTLRCALAATRTPHALMPCNCTKAEVCRRCCCITC